jgi:hypothetical protein
MWMPCWRWEQFCGHCPDGLTVTIMTTMNLLRLLLLALSQRLP